AFQAENADPSPSLRLSEFVAIIEPWHLLRVGNAASNGHRNFCFLQHAGKIPGLAILVRWLVIVRGVVSLELLFTPFLRMADVVIPFLQADRRDANLRKRKVIRAIKRSLLRARVGRHPHTAFASDGLNY